MIKNLAFPIIILIICCTVVYNPQHDRELLTTILIGGFLVYRILFKDLKIPITLPFCSVVLYTIIITLSYFSTIGSSMNYRPLYIQYLGIMAFTAVYTTKPKFLNIAIIIAATIMSILYLTDHYNTGFKYYTQYFMHRNVAGMFFATAIALCYNKKYWFFLPVFIWTLLITGSRGAVGALVIASLIYFIINKNMIGLILMVLITTIAWFSPNPFSDRIHTLGILHDNGRLTYLTQGWEYLKQFPIFGCGIGNLHYHNYLNNRGLHNLFLSIHSSGGIIAIITFFIPIIISFKKQFNPAIATILLYGIVSECGANTPPNNVIFWSLLANSLPINSITIKNSQLKRLSKIIAIIIYVYFSLWAYNHYRAMIAIVDNIQNPNLEYMNTAINVEPKNYKLRYYRAVYFLEKGMFLQARDDFVVTEFLCPNFAETRRALRRLK